MKRSIFFGLVILVISGLSACSSYNYYTAGLNKTNMTQYRSFAWMPMENNTTSSKTVTASAIADMKIKDATTTALQTKGLRLSQRNPDLVVSYSSMVGRGTKINYYPVYYGAGYPGFGYGFGGGWGGYGWGYRSSYYAFGAPFEYYGGMGTVSDKEHYKEGTLIIDLIDTHTKRVVWRGYGVGEVHRDPKKTIEDLPKVVDGIISQLNLTHSVRS